MKAIIYCRVSTKEQAEQGYSLEGQEKECRKFASDQGYEVDKIFIERGESAKTTDRTQLQKLIKYTVENKKTLAVIIIWKYDRLARNLPDQTELVKSFSSCGVKVLSVTENNEENSVGRLMRNIIGSFAQYENDVKGERTINGMRQALLSGRWCWRPHIGYKHEKNLSGKSILVPSVDAPFIIKAFKLAETGLYKQADIVKELRKEGFKKLTEKRLHVVLKNPIYAGILNNDWLTEPVNGIHQALISKDAFYKVQLILSGKRKKITPYNRNHPDFPLRNFVCCIKCGNKLTGSWSRGRKGVKYPYYRCFTKDCSLNLKKQELEHRFKEHLESYHPNQDALDLFEVILQNVWKEKQTNQIKQQSQIEQSIKTLTTRKDRLDELVIKGTMDDETYKIKIKEITEEVSIKHVELREITIGLGNDFEDCLKYCRFFMSNIATNWEKGDIDLKQRFQNLIFPEKVYYENGTFRTTATACIFKQLQGKSPDLSDLVAPSGFTWNQILQDIENIFKFKDLVPMSEDRVDLPTKMSTP